MHVYTVTKRAGTKDTEFEAYARLLAEQGVDLSNVPRTPESGTAHRWLYVWNEKAEAERFKKELAKRTRQQDWYVREFETDKVPQGPLSPLTIYMGRAADGFTYGLHPNSKELIRTKFPGVSVLDSIFVGTDTQQDITIRFKQTWWDQLSVMLTGLSLDKIMEIGGYQIHDPISKKNITHHLP